MASGDKRAHLLEGLSGHGLRVGIIRARWNTEIVNRLADGVRRGLDQLDVGVVVERSVPGCFELPLAAKHLALSGEVDAIVCIGAVIRGETTHYELVSEGAANGIMAAQLETGRPIAFGLVTVEDEAQALARSEGPGGHNVGEEAAIVAVEMARLVG
ncbi:MAG: 6,7-dimethyl-8-ribityllumazine synthase [Actinomycetota bacterium]|nr:6,7-dimethyl-8-ribityllumazine synthase [Actinomycetota bacterium]